VPTNSGLSEDSQLAPTNLPVVGDGTSCKTRLLSRPTTALAVSFESGFCRSERGGGTRWLSAEKNRAIAVNCRSGVGMVFSLSSSPVLICHAKVKTIVRYMDCTNHRWDYRSKNMIVDSCVHRYTPNNILYIMSMLVSLAHTWPSVAITKRCVLPSRFLYLDSTDVCKWRPKNKCFYRLCPITDYIVGRERWPVLNNIHISLLRQRRYLQNWQGRLMILVQAPVHASIF